MREMQAAIARLSRDQSMLEDVVTRSLSASADMACCRESSRVSRCSTPWLSPGSEEGKCEENDSFKRAERPCSRFSRMCTSVSSRHIGAAGEQTKTTTQRPLPRSGGHTQPIPRDSDHSVSPTRVSGSAEKPSSEKALQRLFSAWADPQSVGSYDAEHVLQLLADIRMAQNEVSGSNAQSPELMARRGRVGSVVNSLIRGRSLINGGLEAGRDIHQTLKRESSISSMRVGALALWRAALHRYR